MGSVFLHQLPDVQQLFDAIGQEINVLPILVEKDYWLMHSLWGLKQQDFNFELKGGTSLSNGFDIIKRFSEDIYISIFTQILQKILRSEKITTRNPIFKVEDYFLTSLHKRYPFLILLLNAIQASMTKKKCATQE